jgi:Immunoglobulin domain
MKKALTLVVLIVTPTMAFAQGTVNFQNQTGLVKQWTSMYDSTLISVPKNGGYVQLIAAPKGTPLPYPLITYGGIFDGGANFNSLAAFLAANPGWDAAVNDQGAVPGLIGLGAGIFNCGTYTINNIAEGAQADYLLIGWTGNYSSLDAAIAASTLNMAASFLGESAIATTSTGDPLATPVGTPVTLRTTFAGMTVGPLCLGPYFIGFTAGPTNQTVVRGATATFYVGARACPGPYYQWYFNGVSIPGAAGSSLQISNAQLTNAGTYWVVLSNPLWSCCGGSVHVSPSATLTVLAEPVITSPPQSQTACAGATVSLWAGVTGSPPLAYRWVFNTTNAPAGGTDPVLRLTNVQPAQAGAYVVVVTNVAGAATSAPAMLSVIPPVERRMVPALSLLGRPGSRLSLEVAATLDPSPAWVTLDSVILTNASQWYFDVSKPLPPQRFYRTRLTGGLSVPLALNLTIVPAISLTGSVGSSVRVDYINQFGPIDAWVALDTVIVTSASQLYFDVSALAQPPRLYRLVQVP